MRLLGWPEDRYQALVDAGAGGAGHQAGDSDGFVADELLDGFASRPDARILARYAQAHLRSPGGSPARAGGT